MAYRVNINGEERELDVPAQMPLLWALRNELQMVGTKFGCQAGQLMNASALLARNPSPSPEQIDSAMAGNICRCACYTRIRDAIALAAEKGPVNA